MGEVKIEVKQFVIEYECDECHKGALRPAREKPLQGLNGEGMSFPYVCPICGAKKLLQAKYPAVVIEPVGKPEQRIIPDEETAG
jgi:hypothetical protein